MIETDNAFIRIEDIGCVQWYIATERMTAFVSVTYRSGRYAEFECSADRWEAIRHKLRVWGEQGKDTDGITRNQV